MSRPQEFEVTAGEFAALLARQQGEQDFQDRYQQEIRTSRLDMALFSAVICTCPRWFSIGAVADMQTCAVHGQYIVDDEGKVI